MNAHEISSHESARPMLASGTAIVIRVDAEQGRLVLDAAEGPRQAVRAASCLVLPATGDTVAWMAADDGGAFVTAVLRRDADVPLTLSLPAGAVLESPGGALTLQADTLALRARTLSVEGESAHMSVEQVRGVGQTASWSFGVVKLTAELLESFAERVLQFSRWSQRMVDGPDQVRARQIDYRAEQTMQLQAQALIANADKLFKADSDQIHLG